MFLRKTPTSPPASAALLLARLVGGGALVIASTMKIQGGAKVFAMSIESFQLVPQALLLPLAYYLPWLELAAGLALVLGLWARQSAAICAGLYIAFIFGLASVLARGLPVDCGCFGDLFGPGVVGWNTILRNIVLTIATAATIYWGPGRFALAREGKIPAKPLEKHDGLNERPG